MMIDNEKIETELKMLKETVVVQNKLLENMCSSLVDLEKRVKTLELHEIVRR